jgi:uncharacterized membrane protein
MFARRENQLMLQLSEKGTQYAKSMKIITILCMAFLPPSLIAVCSTAPFSEWSSWNIQAIFGMGVFGNPELGVGLMLVLFFAVSILLCALTYGSWLVWDRRRKRQSADEEQAVSSGELRDGVEEKTMGPGSFVDELAANSEAASVELGREER